MIENDIAPPSLRLIFGVTQDSSPGAEAEIAETPNAAGGVSFVS